MAQPNNILLNLENIYQLTGSNDTNYYYKDGVVYLDGLENINEAKEVKLNAEQINRTTRIKSSTELTGSAGTFVTHEGISIDYNPNDEIYVSHNYVNSDDIDRDYNSSTIRNSWWYDTKKHRSYKVYMLLRYNRSYVIGGITYYDWRVIESYVSYKDATADATDGTYTFSTIPPNDIDFTASVKVEAPRGFNTWEQASLNVYKNNTFYTSSLITAPNTVNGRITTQFIISASSVVLDDTWKMSVEVDGNPAVVQDPLQVPEYTMSFNTITPPKTPSFLGFVTTDDINDFPDCQPTLNNAVDLRQSAYIDDVDYSTGVTTPQNIGLIVGGTATKAATPDSNYTQYSHTLIRYYGVKTNRTAVNTGSVAVFDPNVPENSSPYSFTTDNLGAVPNIEWKDYYVGFFNRIVDTYPLLNNKTAYFVQYLVDRNEDLFDPSISDINLSNLRSTFRLKDINGESTSVKPSLITKNDADELKGLEAGLSTVYKTGEFPTPILYSQNSSNNYTSSITLFNGENVVKSTPITSTTGYWEFMDGTSKEIYLVDSNLNSVYDTEYIMQDQTYFPGPNNNFPLSIEPEFTEFPPIVEKFNIKVNDELRFENDESKTFVVTGVRQEDISGDTKVVLTLDKDLVGVNKDFFVLRRFSPISNYVILNQQKPYSNPPEKNSTFGILSPQFTIDDLKVSADAIASTLTQEQSQEVIVNNTINIPETEVNISNNVTVPTDPTPAPTFTYYTLTKCSDGSTGYRTSRNTDAVFLSNNDRVIDTAGDLYTISGTTEDESITAIRVNSTGQTGCSDGVEEEPPTPVAPRFYSLINCADDSIATTTQTTDTISLAVGDRVTAGSNTYRVAGTAENPVNPVEVTPTGEVGCPTPPVSPQTVRFTANGSFGSVLLRYVTQASNPNYFTSILGAGQTLSFCVDINATSLSNGYWEIINSATGLDDITNVTTNETGISCV